MWFRFSRKITFCCFAYWWLCSSSHTSVFRHLQALEISRMTEDYRDYSLSVQLIDSLVTPPMFLVSSWMDNRVKTPAKSLQAWAFSLGKPVLPATSSPSPSHATSPGQILSQFPGHIEAVLWPPLPCWWCHDKKHKLRFDELENLIPACKELLSVLCRVNVKMSTLIIQRECR